MNREIALQRVALKTEEKRADEEEKKRKLKEKQREEASGRMQTQIAEVKGILANMTLALEKIEKQTSNSAK